MKLEDKSNQYLSTGPLYYQKPRNRPLLRVVSYVLLFATASLLSFVAPTPWSILRTGKYARLSPRPTLSFLADPAEDFKDDIWPIRQPTPWDISTDFPYPRSLEFDVEEGTWLRLDVHPKTGDIVFDMIGDLYCIPASEAYAQGARAKARPILLGVPHDADPHFSPDGEQLVFRSDAELGVDNIWVLPWAGCEALDLRPTENLERPLMVALDRKPEEDRMLSMGIKETLERKTNRLIREGRTQARRVTNETFRYVSDPRFHPSGTTVIVTKWYTSSRSLGAGEGWQYNVSTSGPISSGSGKRIVGRTLPSGWDPADYNSQQIGPEQLIWADEDVLIYSKNVIDQDSGTFEYSKDTHQGIYSIFSYNLTSKQTQTLVSSSSGGASRPELSRDGRTLAFVRRFRDYGALVLKDLETGTVRHIWHGLNYDLGNIAAPMGTYPSFAFDPHDTSIVIWAAGQIHVVPLTTNRLGEKVAGDTPYPIKFTAHIEKQLAETRKHEFDLLSVETADELKVTAFKSLAADTAGKRVVFQAAGVTYVQVSGEEEPRKVPVLYDDGVTPYYSPSFIEDGDYHLVIHSRWSDTNFTSFEIANLDENAAHEIQGLPRGRYLNPIVSVNPGKMKKIAFVKTGGDTLTGNVVATAKPGLYVGDLEAAHPPILTNLAYIPTEISPDDQLVLHFIDGNSKILVQQSRRAFIIDLVAPRDENGKPPHTNLVSGRMSSQVAIPPSFSTGLQPNGHKTSSNIAFIDFMQVYFASGDNLGADEQLWSKPGNATKGLVRVSLDGGHDLAWTGDGETLFWFLGPYLHSLQVSKLSQCASAIESDPINFGISCVKDLVEFQHIHVTHSTDIARLKKDARLTAAATGNDVDLADFFVISNATVLTMETGVLEKDLIHNAVVVLKGGVIHNIAELGKYEVPRRATVINAEGGYVLPGFLDVHAHWSGWATSHPAKSWEMETFLAYGVTTLHNPSAGSRDGFNERSRLERGHFVGPRIFQTGEVIYGAADEGLHQDIVDMNEARSALIRIKAEGGASATSYKNYQLPSRASRQMLLLQARELNMLCVPEGGMNYDWDLTYIQDGMTTVEHSIPVPVLYEDVLKFFALSGTTNTPTHIVNYGGAWGEQLLWATQDLPNDPKLRRFTRHDTLEEVTESHARPVTSYALFNTSASIAKMVTIGNGTFRTHIGAHGEPPLGIMYHAELLYTAGGGYRKGGRSSAGLNNYDTLQAATSWAAQTFGFWKSLGSVTPGKLADLVVYPPGVDLLDGAGLERSKELRYVIRGGRVWDAEFMDQVWPLKKKRQVVPPFNAE